MRLRLVLAIVLLCAVAAVWACSLNPQPIPPDTYDASFDVMTNPAPDAAGGVPESGSGDDGATPTTADGGSDANAADAESDAEDAADAEDASDATDDSPVDAGDEG